MQVKLNHQNRMNIFYICKYFMREEQNQNAKFWQNDLAKRGKLKATAHTHTHTHTHTKTHSSRISNGQVPQEIKDEINEPW